MIWEHLPKGERLFSESTRVDFYAGLVVLAFWLFAIFA
jgi:hypothetical protein